MYIHNMGALWCIGLCPRLVPLPRNHGVGGSNLPSAYAPRQGILSTIVSLNPGVVNGYLVQVLLKMLQR